MRERLAQTADNKLPRLLATALAMLVILWVATAPLLDKRWHEVVLDVLPYVLVGVALIRTPSTLRVVSERMKDYEREFGEDPEGTYGGGDGGPAAIAL